MNKVGVKGRFRTQIIEADGSVSFDAGEQDNLITDGALDYGTFPGGNTYLCLGSGVVTTPAITDTNLGNQIATAYINIGTNRTETDTGLGYEISKSGTCNFDGLDADISELGLRIGSASTSTLITRALIKDINGEPTTITVGPGQTLKLTYTLFWFMPKFISSGITPTPHGDLHWEIKIYMAYGALEGQAFGFDPLSKMMIAGTTSTVSTSTRDIANRKTTVEATRPAQSTDKTITAGTAFAYPYAYNPRVAYRVYLTQDFTIPANYDFTMAIESSWGRYS
jgi:hypothetical protein